ncbi:MAG: hypothetical protein MMC33_008928 [Icmadophila ericetorum]|nr:hypothetical protein [Icmadophila ericetorum]
MASKANLGGGFNLHKPQKHASTVQKGQDGSQITRAAALGSYFISGVMAIVATQFLGGPLYLVNREWYNAWISFTKQSFGLLTTTMTQWWAPTKVRVSGDKSVRGELFKTTDGNLLCNFPERLVLMANHQIYTDWLYLWWVGYCSGMHGRIIIILKESLRKIPIIGWGMQFSNFIFLKRNWAKDQPRLAAHLQKLNVPTDPMWLMIFPEGTNLAECTKQKSKEWASNNGIPDMKHQLLPRSTGILFCLRELRKTVSWVYDCTIAYEGVPRGQFAQDIFTLRESYLEGRPPKSVNMYWRRFHVSTIPLDDPQAFDLWLRTRWTEKDALIEHYYRHGLFPADTGVDKAPDGTTRRGAGHIETEVKALRWYEFLQIFAPIGLFGLVLYMFYGALPRKLINSITAPDVVKKIEGLQKQQIEGKPIKLPSSDMLNKKVKEFKKATADQQIAVTVGNTRVILNKGMDGGAVDVKTILAAHKAIRATTISKAGSDTASIKSAKTLVGSAAGSTTSSQKTKVSTLNSKRSVKAVNAAPKSLTQLKPAVKPPTKSLTTKQQVKPKHKKPMTDNKVNSTAKKPLVKPNTGLPPKKEAKQSVSSPVPGPKEWQSPKPMVKNSSMKAPVKPAPAKSGSPKTAAASKALPTKQAKQPARSAPKLTTKS